MDQKERQPSKCVLLFTDIAACTMDVPTTDCIIQYTAPQTDEDYVHRVRKKQKRFAIIFLTHEEQEKIDRLQEHSFPKAT